MKNMKRSERRARTQNIIEKRRRIIKEIWKDSRCYPQEGRLRKYNFTCDCALCKNERLEKRLHPKVKYIWYYNNYDMS